MGICCWEIDKLKILFFTHQYPNYIPDLLLHGLRKILGPDVIDYPRKDCLYDGVLGLGVCSEELLCQNWFPQDSGTIDREDILEKITNKYFDYIICDIRAATYLKNLVTKLTLEPSYRLVIIDGEDTPVLIKMGNYVICRRETDGSDFSIPLPMSLPEEVLNRITSYDENKKTYTVGFIGAIGKMAERRRVIVEKLDTLYPDCLFNITEAPEGTGSGSNGRVGRDEYYAGLQSCSIVLNLRGAGNDTFRFWENAACNALHVSEVMPLFIPNDFDDKQNIRRFSDFDELRKIIDEKLANKQETDQMIQNSRQHLMYYHLTTSRATYFLDKIKEAFN